MTLKDFVPLDKIGEGSFATVYKVQRISDNQIYALKKIKMNRLSQKSKQLSLNEVRLLASLQSPNIVKYFQSFYQEELDVLSIVMEYAENGDLGHLIKKYQQEKKLFRELQIWKTLIHLLKGLGYLHDSKVLHRDLKCENILKCGEIYKIGDMNVSKINRSGMAETQTGTPYYASPEVWKDQPYDQKSDIWSLGCVIYEMTALQPPFKGKNMNDLYKNVTKGIYPSLPKCYSNQLSDVIKMCLNLDPKKRPSASDILENFTVKMYQNLCGDIEPCVKGVSKGMLSTIVMPENRKELNNHLPKSRYQNKNEQFLIIEKKKTEQAQPEVNKQKPRQISPLKEMINSQAKQELLPIKNEIIKLKQKQSKHLKQQKVKPLISSNKLISHLKMLKTPEKYMNQQNRVVHPDREYNLKLIQQLKDNIVKLNPVYIHKGRKMRPKKPELFDDKILNTQPLKSEQKECPQSLKEKKVNQNDIQKISKTKSTSLRRTQRSSSVKKPLPTQQHSSMKQIPNKVRSSSLRSQITKTKSKNDLSDIIKSKLNCKVSEQDKYMRVLSEAKSMLLNHRKYNNIRN